MKLKITYTRSVIGRPQRQRATVQALGLRRLNQSVVHEATPQILGMVRSIPHLLQVEELND
jgi:large subunit ribosomal protein L30